MMDTEQLTAEQEARIEKARNRIKAILKSHGGRGNSHLTTSEEFQNAQALATAIARDAGLELYAIEKELGRDDRFEARQVQTGGHSAWHFQLATVVSNALITRIIFHINTVVTNSPNRRSGKWTRQKKADYVTIVGMPEDIEMVEYLYNHIRTQLEKVTESEYKRVLGEIREKNDHLFANDADLGVVQRINLWTPTPQGKSWRDDFRRGAVKAIEARLNKMFKERMPEMAERGQEETMALVVVKEAAVEDAKNQFFPKLGGSYQLWKKAKPQSTRAWNQRENAYMAGREAGKKISIQPGVSGGPAGYLE